MQIQYYVLITPVSGVEILPGIPHLKIPVPGEFRPIMARRKAIASLKKYLLPETSPLAALMQGGGLLGEYLERITNPAHCVFAVAFDHPEHALPIVIESTNAEAGYLTEARSWELELFQALGENTAGDPVPVSISYDPAGRWVLADNYRDEYSLVNYRQSA